MIFIEFNEPISSRIWKRWRAACSKGTRKLKDEVKAGERPQITSLYKWPSVKGRFYFGEDCAFQGKCAYCETYLLVNQSPDIDHYRPKQGVADERGKPVLVDYGTGEAEEHRGYYWLAYDWKNLLPSCEKCNRASLIKEEIIGKYTRFPVSGPHALHEDEIASEKPLLINPLVDDPDDFIRVNTENGLLEGKDGDGGRGETTIRILGLNTREQLHERRKK